MTTPSDLTRLVCGFGGTVSEATVNEKAPPRCQCLDEGGDRGPLPDNFIVPEWRVMSRMAGGYSASAGSEKPVASRNLAAVKCWNDFRQTPPPLVSIQRKGTDVAGGGGGFALWVGQMENGPQGEGASGSGGDQRKVLRLL